jgi:hypothetical protein
MHAVARLDQTTRSVQISCWTGYRFPNGQSEQLHYCNEDGSWNHIDNCDGERLVPAKIARCRFLFLHRQTVDKMQTCASFLCQWIFGRSKKFLHEVDGESFWMKLQLLWFQMAHLRGILPSGSFIFKRSFALSITLLKFCEVVMLLISGLPNRLFKTFILMHRSAFSVHSFYGPTVARQNFPSLLTFGELPSIQLAVCCQRRRLSSS